MYADEELHIIHLINKLYSPVMNVAGLYFQLIEVSLVFSKIILFPGLGNEMVEMFRRNTCQCFSASIATQSYRFPTASAKYSLTQPQYWN
mmetsp:Transcript_4316/g.9438  ORF Transcript_4316/g.9438 Transcript_4316/m.9438 type:complete len:90 (+) Transcript_4316:198-467(+)